ncbi:MAG: TIGR01212 family radical SAM protein [Candidatus Melainabacteria bacterium RIFCSPLOWO2_02_FULL_35_15]|nr:MAG: TIGR01212 family radical SAM protein [Candidatus Melainabacteria bacterium RIFCSPLOWO2_02_FULL_35_15]
MQETILKSNLQNNILYYSLSSYLKKRFSTKVQRITLEANLDCPNRDGTKAYGGCTFCTADGSSAGAFYINGSISKQLEDGVKLFSKRFKAGKFISYLQSFTNTYASTDKLKKIYDEAISCPDIVVLAIGTRPDCLSEEILDLIETYKEKVEIWLDIGLQTVHDKTLDFTNRAHTEKDFFDALYRAKKRGLIVCAHTIFGLPGETKEMFYETMKKLAASPIDAVKIHQLLVLEKTKIAKQYSDGLFKALELEEYISLVCDFLEILPPNVVIHRLFAEAKPGELIAPKWAAQDDDRRHKQQVLRMIEDELVKRGTRQGSKYR